MGTIYLVCYVLLIVQKFTLMRTLLLGLFICLAFSTVNMCVCLCHNKGSASF